MLPVQLPNELFPSLPFVYITRNFYKTWFFQIQNSNSKRSPYRIWTSVNFWCISHTTWLAFTLLHSAQKMRRTEKMRKIWEWWQLAKQKQKTKKNGELLLSLEILSYRHHKSKIVILFQIWEQHRRVRLWKYQLTNYDKFPLSVKMKGLDLGHSTDHLLPRRLILFRLQKEVTKTASGNKNTTDSVKKM